MKNFTLLLLLTVFGIQMQGQTTFISSMDGVFNDPTTWGGGPADPIPTSIDNVIINHVVTLTSSMTIEDMTIIGGGSFVISSGVVSCNGNLTVSTGTTLNINDKVFRAKGGFINNGDISGTISGRFYIQNPGDIGGTGTFSLLGRLYLNGDRSILASANLDKPDGLLQIGSFDISNFGSFACNDIKVGTSTSWVNFAGSTFTISGDPNSIAITSSATDNTVIFDGSGSADQEIPTPVLGRFYNLTIKGDDVASEKVLTGNINILGELNIEGSTFKAGSASSYDIDIKGNWYNFGGNFDPQQGFVSFNGSDDQEIDNLDGIETFFDLFCSGDGFLNLFVDLDIARNISIDKQFETFGQAFNIGGSWTVTEPSFNLGGSMVTFDENFAGNITGDINFENVTINKTLSSDAITIDSGTTVGISGSLEISNGLLNTNDNLVILSDASGTGRIGDLTNGTINGEVEVQRFLDAIANGWHLMCSPVQGQTLADWDDDIITTGFPGSDYPDFEFNNATNYNESVSGSDRDDGLMNATGSTQSISDLSGWRMYLAAGTTNLDVKGAIFSGDQSLPLSFTDNSVEDEDGWNLVANPFASTINWDATSGWSRSGINDAFYIWDPAIEQYISWVESMGTFTATENIPSSQAFWVQAFEAGPSITVGEAAKVTVDAEFKNNKNHSNYFKVDITASSGYYGEVGIRLDKRATSTFDRNLDAHYLKSPSEAVPGIAVKDELGKAYSIYSRNVIDDETIIPLHVNVPTSDNFTFSFKNVSNFQEASCIKLIDNETGNVTPVADDQSLTVFIEQGEYNDRFSLQLGAPIVSSVVNENCTANEDKIEVIVPEGLNWTINAYNSSNEVVFSESTNGGNFLTGNLNSGDYSLEILSQSGQCSNVYHSLNIPEENGLDIEVEVVSATGSLNNGEISATVEGGLAPYTYSWNNGATAPNIGQLAAGTYLLTVTDARSCSYSTSVVVKGQMDQVSEDKALSSDGIAVLNFQDHLTVQFNLELKQSYNLNVYNSVGQMTHSASYNKVQYDQRDIPTEGFKGLFLVVLENQETKELIVKKVVL